MTAWIRCLAGIAVLGLLGCGKAPAPAQPQAGKPPSSPGTRLTAGDPEFLAGSGWLLVPLYEDGEPVKPLLSSSDGDRGPIRNFVFHESASGQTALVFGGSAIITDYLILEHGRPADAELEEPAPPGRAMGVVFEVRDQPALAGEDGQVPDRVYFVRPGQTRPTPLTPEKTRREWWSWDPQADVVFVLFRSDTDGNGAFEPGDRTQLVRFEVQGATLGPVIDDALMDEATRRAFPPG